MLSRFQSIAKNEMNGRTRQGGEEDDGLPIVRVGAIVRVGGWSPAGPVITSSSYDFS
jgi:hypothetical protein